MTSTQTAGSRAAQPASSNAEQLFSEELPSPSSAEQPASCSVYSFHAYNVGWNFGDKQRTADSLGEELVRHWCEHQFNAIGISEVFEVAYPPHRLVEVDARRKEILSSLVEQLNYRVCAGWHGRRDDHCLYLWHESLHCIASDYVSLNVKTQPWRRSQYFCFQPPDCIWPIHIYHCHCPSASQRKKNSSAAQPAKDRRFLPAARKTAVESICKHAAQRHAALHQVGVAQPDFPAVLFTGDWNLPLYQWSRYLHPNLPNHVRKNVQVVKSTIRRNCKHGDVTIAINCKAFQEESPKWTTFSDAHDIVIASVSLPAMQVEPPVVQPVVAAEELALQMPRETLPAIQVPTSAQQVTNAASELTSMTSSEAPASGIVSVSLSVQREMGTAEDPALQMFHGSAEQPALDADDLGIPLDTTPLSLQMITNLSEVDDEEIDTSALDELEKTFMFRDVPNKPVPGHWDAEKPKRVERLEWVLELLKEQRDLHTRKLQQRRDPRISAAQPDIQFSENDMKEIMNSWRNDPQKWMHPNHLGEFWNMTNAQRHNFGKSRFSVMKFHLLGHETLVDHIIRNNLCGAVRPDMLADFCDRWQRYMQTDLYRKARQESEKREPGHVRRAKRIWYLKQELRRAKWISDWIDEEWSNWYSLSRSDQNLYNSIEDLRRELEEVRRTQAGVRYGGSGLGIAQMSTSGGASVVQHGMCK